MRVRYGQIFVHALGSNGKWGNHDVFHLTDESFRAFVMDLFLRVEAVHAIKDAGPEVTLVSTRPTPEDES